MTDTTISRNMDRQTADRVKAWDYGNAFHAILDLEGIAADTPYIIVPKSGTSMPHSGDESTAIIVRSLHIQAEVESSGVYDILFGVVTENDATDGSVDWFARFQLETTNANALSFVRQWGSGLNTKISSGAPTNLITNSRQQASSNWQNDAYRTTPFGSALPAVGDVVMLVEEVSGSGTIDLMAEVEYDIL